MPHELREIPPAPRLVRWTSVVWQRWPLAMLGVTMLVYGGLVALMLFYARGGKPRDDAWLDRGPVAHAPAVVERVAPTNAMFEGAPAHQIFYRFITDGGTPLFGSSFGPAAAAAGSVTVEYLLNYPEKNRLLGTRISLLGDYVTPVLAAVVLPGLAVLGLWLMGVLRLRHLLSVGDIALSEPARIEQMAWIVPVTLRVDYRFRDHRARWCEGHHWVRARSPLGERLRHAQRVLVVHDRRQPQRNRLVTANDFRPRPTRRSSSIDTTARRA